MASLTTIFWSPVSDLITDVAHTGKTCNDSICPIKWMFLALLDSNEKTGQDGQLNRLILIDNLRTRKDYSGHYAPSCAGPPSLRDDVVSRLRRSARTSDRLVRSIPT